MASKNFEITQLQSDGGLLTLHPETNAGVVQETSTKKIMTSDERTKLSGIAENAQVNVIEEIKVNGTKVNPVGKSVDITIDDQGKIPSTEKGVANGVATLDETGKVPSSQLPSYVDDVLEYASKSGFPVTGEAGKIYVDKATNLTYRWSGSGYTEISPSLALGETSSTAYPGSKGKENADNITSIKNGTTKVGDAGKLEGKAGSYYLDYNNFTNKPTIPTIPSLSKGTNEGSGTFIKEVKVNGHVITEVHSSIAVSDLPASGVTAGSYSAVTVDAKGRVTAGAQVLEIGTDGQNTPSSTLAVGGLFFKVV